MNDNSINAGQVREQRSSLFQCCICLLQLTKMKLNLSFRANARPTTVGTFSASARSWACCAKYSASPGDPRVKYICDNTNRVEKSPSAVRHSKSCMKDREGYVLFGVGCDYAGADVCSSVRASIKLVISNGLDSKDGLAEDWGGELRRPSVSTARLQTKRLKHALQWYSNVFLKRFEVNKDERNIRRHYLAVLNQSKDMRSHRCPLQTLDPCMDPLKSGQSFLFRIQSAWMI